MLLFRRSLCTAHGLPLIVVVVDYHLAIKFVALVFDDLVLQCFGVAMHSNDYGLIEVAFAVGVVAAFLRYHHHKVRRQHPTELGNFLQQQHSAADVQKRLRPLEEAWRLRQPLLAVR